MGKLNEKLIEKKLVRGYDYEEENVIFYSGLPYMLNKDYFEDAFMLHDESEKTKEFNKMMEEMMKDEENNNENSEHMDAMQSINNNKKKIDTKTAKDARSVLEYKRASLKNMFSFQPLFLIRNYFGEYIAFYFGFCGTMLASLWIPVFAGIAFFVVGMIDR